MLKNTGSVNDCDPAAAKFKVLGSVSVALSLKTRCRLTVPGPLVVTVTVYEKLGQVPDTAKVTLVTAKAAGAEVLVAVGELDCTLIST